MTNAERAARAEMSLLAYIVAVEDNIASNGPELWMQDLITDLHHLADKLGVKINCDVSTEIFELELSDQEPGAFISQVPWTREATQ